MSNFSRKAVAVGLALTTAAWLAGSVLPASAQTSAATIATLMAQIQALQAQLTALQGGSTGSSVTASYNYTRDLTVGDKGADVTALQQMLVAQGDLVMPTGVAYGYFGPLTKTALAKYQAANGIKPASGFFGPITRAYVAAHTTGTTTGTGTGTTPVGAPMSVSLASDSPMATNVAAGAINTPVLRLNFTAGATPVTVTNLVLTRSGLSQDSDLNNVYLYQGANRLATNLGFNNGKITFSNGAGLFTVPANSSMEVTVTADINSAAGTGHIFMIGLNSASDITASGATFTGAFPVNGGQMTVASVSNLATLTLSGYSSSTVNVNAGQTNYLVGQFNLQAGNDPVKVTSFRFTNIGSADPSSIQNVKLMQGSTQLGATLTTLPSNNVAVFDLSGNPLMLASGQTVVLSLYADVMGSVNRTFQFSLQQSSDITAVDTMYGVGIGASLSGSATFPVYFYSANINNGGVVLSKDASSPTTAVVAGNTNQLLAKFDVLASGDSVKFNELDFGVGTLSGTGNLQNFRVVDDQGTQLGTTATNVSSTATYKAGTGNLNYIVPANTTRVLSVYGDVPSGETGSIQITLSGGSAQSYTTFSSITLGSIAGNSLQVLASSSNLTAALNYSLGSPVQASANGTNVKIASFNFTAGQVNAVNLTGVTLNVTSNSTAAGYLRNVRVMYGSQQVGNTQSLVTASQPYTFNTGAPIAIAANSTITLDVYADIGSVTTATSTTNVIQLASVNASTATGNAVSVTAQNGQTVSFNLGGTLAASVDPATPATQYAGMSVTGIKLATYRFSADQYGNESLTQVTVTDSASASTSTTAAGQSDFVNYRLTDASGNTLGTASEISNVLTFNLTGLNVPVSNYATVNLVADANVYPYATSGDAHAYWLTGFQYTSAAGSQTTSTAVHGNLFTIYRTTLSLAQGPALPSPTGGSLSNGRIVGEFNFTAGTGYQAVISTTTIAQAGSIVGSTTTVPVEFYDAANPSVILASTTISSSTSATPYINLTVPAGTTKTLVVQVNGSPADTIPSTNAVGTYQLSISGVTWNDGVGAVTSLDPSINMATAGAGQTTTGLAN